jgi:hypothetical protein
MKLKHFVFLSLFISAFAYADVSPEDCHLLNSLEVASAALANVDLETNCKGKCFANKINTTRKRTADIAAVVQSKIIPNIQSDLVRNELVRIFDKNIFRNSEEIVYSRWGNLCGGLYREMYATARELKNFSIETANQLSNLVSTTCPANPPVVQ